jgi:hypothetical protein
MMYALSPPACGDLAEARQWFTDPLGLPVLGMYALVGGLVGAGAAIVTGRSLGSTAWLGATVTVAGVLTWALLQPSKPKPAPTAPLAHYGY